ncbi:MAG: type II toxin-antitoxin system VapC family toxin [Candidatus Velthaea sp.]|jgi:predicted nucleic acid-binding protein
MSIVIDASIAIAWSFPDERDAESVAAGRYVLRERALVPALWRWEVQNVLRNAEKRGRISEDTTSHILRSLAALPLSVDPSSTEVTFGAELQLARRFALTAYDAAYLELAVRRGIRLATKDAALRAAAEQLDLLWKPAA